MAQVVRIKQRVNKDRLPILLTQTIPPSTMPDAQEQTLLIELPVQLPVLPEMASNPYSHNVLHAVAILQALIERSNRLLVEEDVDPLRLSAHYERLEGEGRELLIALESSNDLVKVPAVWTRQSATQLGSLIVALRRKHASVRHRRVLPMTISVSPN